MSSFLVDVWAFLTNRRDHPVYRHETEGWSYLSLWRKVRRGCLPSTALVLAGPAACCGLLSISLIENPGQPSLEWLIVPFAALTGLFAGGELIRWLTGLLATALTSTVLSSEVEAETYDLLRVTPLPVHEIVLAKFSASFQQFRLPLTTVILTRGVFILGLLALGSLLVASNATPLSSSLAAPSPPLVSEAELSAASVAASVIVGASALLAGLIWFLYFLAAPVLGTFIYAAIGLLASAWARTRTGGLVGAAGLRAALWVASYIAGQFVSVFFSVLTVPVLALPSTPLWLQRLLGLNPALLVLSGASVAMIWALVLVAAQLTVGLLLIYMATCRAGRPA